MRYASYLLELHRITVILSPSHLVTINKWPIQVFSIVNKLARLPLISCAHAQRGCMDFPFIHIYEKSTEPQLNSTLIYYAIRWFHFIKIAAKVYFIWFEAQVNLNNISTTTKKKYYGSLYIFKDTFKRIKEVIKSFIFN